MNVSGSKFALYLEQDILHGIVVAHSVMGGSSDQSSMVDPLSYFLFQPVLHDWCHKGCGMCYPVCDDGTHKIHFVSVI